MKLKLKQIGPRKLEVSSDDWSYIVDLREKFGGENAGPNPSELLAGSVAACEVLTGVYWASNRHGIELRDVEAEVEWEYGQSPERVARVDVAIRNVGPQLGDEKKLKAFKGIAKGCLVTKTLKISPELNLDIE